MGRDVISVMHFSFSEEKISRSSFKFIQSGWSSTSHPPLSPELGSAGVSENKFLAVCHSKSAE